nr:MAG TPA: hypothetical protein [Bacteriophage sp.]
MLFLCLKYRSMLRVVSSMTAEEKFSVVDSRYY